MATGKLPTEAEKEQIFGMAQTEMEYRVELFNRTYILLPKSKGKSMKVAEELNPVLTATCFNKCIEKRYKESELHLGENSCIDRCVSKYMQVNNLVGQLLQNPPM